MMIATSEDLQRVAERVAGADAIGLDTEFMRERTYRAELCLLQISAAGIFCCVDPILLTDLEPLRKALNASGAVKVLHAARQDLEVLHPVVGAIGPVFDTQIAAALAGYAAQVGYGELVRVVLEKELPKAHTRTDWSRRPLSPEQVEYAIDDVRYLDPLREQLLGKIKALGRSDWLAEELAAFADPSILAVDPDRAWLRVKSLQGLDPARTGLARSLAAWRERRAIARNRPRGWILDDAVMREIVFRVPRTRADLTDVAEMPDGVIKHSGDELLELIDAARIPDPAPPLPRRERPDPTVLATLKRLADLVQRRATELALATELLATRRDLESLVRGDPDTVVLQGWRREVIGEALRAAL